MPVMDEFKKEREMMKDQPFSKRAEYFWDYYKWWVIAGIAIILAIVFTVRGILLRKNDVLYITLVNTVVAEENDFEEAFSAPFLSERGYNTKKDIVHMDADYVITLDDATVSAEELMSSAAAASSSNIYGGGQQSSVMSAQDKLSVYIAGGSVDIMYGSDAMINNYAYHQIFSPVSDYMTDEEMAEYSDYLYYIDYAVIDRYKKAHDEMNFDFNEKSLPSDDKDSMENPVAIGFCLENCEAFTKNYICAEGDAKHLVMSVVINSKNRDLAKDFVTELLNSNQ